MKENVVKTKSFDFAIVVVMLYKKLIYNKKEFVMSKQLLRSGTSVGAMVREAEHAESLADFKHKMAIAQKEINEALYWIELMHKTEYLTANELERVHPKAVEIMRLLTTIIKSAKSTLKSKPKP